MAQGLSRRQSTELLSILSVILDVPSMRYLAVDGAGDPNTSTDFARVTSTLYPVAYAMKFASQRELGRDYVVPPLEGLWWSDDMDSFTSACDKARWSWTLMVMIPEWVGGELIADVLERSASKVEPAWLAALRVDTLHEGRCVQTLHAGSFDDEAPVLERMHHDFLPAHGLVLSGTHHEIYLSDPRRTSAARLRTILRQPVIPAPS